MLDLDLRTLYFSFILLLIVSLGVVTLLWFQARKRFAGMHFLVLYILAIFTGVALITFRGVIPDFISIVVANMFVVSGAIAGYLGLEKFVELKTSRWRFYLGFSLFLCIQIFFTYIHNNQQIRNLNVGFSLMLISLDTAFLLLFRVGKSMRKITSALGLVFSFLVIVGLFRIGRFLFTDAVGYDYFHSGSFESYVALLYQISFYLLIFFLSLAVNKRLINEISEQEEKFSKAFKHSPYGIVISRLNDGYITEVNDGFELISGYNASELIGKTTVGVNLWMEKSDRDSIANELNANKRIKNRVLNFRTASGNPIVCEFSSEVILISEELCLVTVINDITEQKKNESELIKSKSMLRRFASHLQTVGEEEKITLATQIDNELNQALMALKMDIGVLKIRLKGAEANSIPEELFQKLDEVSKVVGKSLGFSLKLMSNLRNEVLYMMGFVEAMKLFVDEFSSNQSKIKCRTDIGELVVQPDQKQSTILYRVFESAMSNVALHSKATEVLISLHPLGNKLELEIIDNGVGFQYNELIEFSSHGLMLMRERISLLDGEMFVTSAPKEGTTIKVLIPLF